MSENQKCSVAMIGLGSMGMGMAQSIARANLPLSAYDINEGALQSIAHQSRIGASPEDAGAGCDIVISAVVNATQTHEVLFGAQGATEKMNPKGVIISCATMSPDDAARLAKMASDKGLDYLDAPISGGSVKAANGELTIMASGSEEAFRKARPALDAMAAKIYELGAAPGIGSSFKMINQLLAGVHIAAACEALTFAKKLGLDLEKVYEVIIGAAGNSWMFENRGRHILAGDYAPHSAVSIFTKDLGIISDMGRYSKFPLPLSSTALQMFIMTAAAGMERDDDASVARMLAHLAGVALPEKTQ